MVCGVRKRDAEQFHPGTFVADSKQCLDINAHNKYYSGRDDGKWRGNLNTGRALLCQRERGGEI